MSKVKTRIERNKEIITEVYERMKKIEKIEERHIKFFLIRDDFLKSRLYTSWSWVDLASLISMIKREMTKEELNKIPVDISYGSWCLGDVVQFLANLIVDYPHIIKELYIKKTKNDKSE
jgi:hypothetical protein